MLIRFHTSNFLSFNEEIELSLIPGRTRQHPTHIVKDQNGCGIDILRAAVIYGANASGKSNLIKALRFAQKFIVKGTRIKESIARIPFKLCQDGASRISKFEFEFKQGERCYIYGFEVDHYRVHAEWLYELKKTTEILLFERTTTSEGETVIEFGKIQFANKKEQEALEFVAMGTRANQLFLTESMERNIHHFKDVYLWFDDVLVIIYPQSRYLPFVNMVTKDNFAEGISSYLKQLGTGIHGFELLEVNPDIEFPEEMLAEFREKFTTENALTFVVGPGDERYTVDLSNNTLKTKKLMFKHRMSDCGEDVLFDMQEESDGTRRLLDLLPQFAKLTGRERVIVVDELDRSLHPRLSYELIKLFLADTLDYSQIIATTHEEHLLDLNLLRRDEIWFVEKDQTGASHVYSLEEFAPRYDKDIERGYIMGRFGAIPVFGHIPVARSV